MYVFNILFGTALFFTINAFSVDVIEKCSLKNEACIKRSYKDALNSIGKTGVPDLGIPPIDPVILDDLSVTVFDSIHLKFKEGTIKGLKNCEIIKYTIDLDKMIDTTKIACDLTIKGHFRISGSGPALESVFGRNCIRGEGKAKVKLGDKLKYNIDVDKVTFAADKIYIGKEDISGFVVTYLNENGKSLLQTFGKVFIDKALDYYSEFLKNLFSKVSVDKIITDDVSAYVSN